MNKIISEKIEDIKKLCIDYDVKFLYLFGSATKSSIEDNSDIDFLIAFKDIPYDKYTDNYFDLHNLFQSLLKREIDLVTENSLSNPFFIESIEKTKELIYED